MDDFGTTMMNTFIDQAFPMDRNVELELISWSDVAEFFFSLAPEMGAKADASPEPWRLSSVAVFDTCLRQIAEAGAWEGDIAFPAICAQEVWRRWKYVIVAAQLEAGNGEPLNLPVPRAAPDGIKGMAVMLYFLAGPGRNYPSTMY